MRNIIPEVVRWFGLIKSNAFIRFLSGLNGGKAARATPHAVVGHGLVAMSCSPLSPRLEQFGGELTLIGGEPVLSWGCEVYPVAQKASGGARADQIQLQTPPVTANLVAVEKDYLPPGLPTPITPQAMRAPALPTGWPPSSIFA